jgi:MFS family permease
MTWTLKYDLDKSERKLITLASLGGLLEFYDFTVYGLFSIYFAGQYFPSHDKFVSIIASYAIFVVGYIARPIGGIIFSHIGDEIGRKIVLILTMVIMGLSSLGIGFLPTYSQIGIFAPILLLFFRLIQGLAIGGELPSMIVYVTESMPKKRGFAIGGVLTGTDAGLVLGMLINFIMVATLNAEQLQNYGWRIPFIFGGLLCFVSYQIRKKLHESAVFEKSQNRPKFPLGHLLANYPLQTLYGVGLVATMSTFVMLTLIFMPTYLKQIANLNLSMLSHYMLIAAFVTIISAYIMGSLANRFDPKKIMIITSISAIFIGYISYNLIAKHHYILLALCLLTMLQGFFATLSPLLISYIFPTEVRLSGVAVSYNLSHAIFGGMAPIVISSLAHYTHLGYMIPVIYIAIAAIVAIISTMQMYKIKLY